MRRRWLYFPSVGETVEIAIRFLSDIVTNDAADSGFIDTTISLNKPYSVVSSVLSTSNEVGTGSIEVDEDFRQRLSVPSGDFGNGATLIRTITIEIESPFIMSVNAAYSKSSGNDLSTSVDIRIDNVARVRIFDAPFVGDYNYPDGSPITIVG